jgi:hypothetical protein
MKQATATSTKPILPGLTDPVEGFLARVWREILAYRGTDGANKLVQYERRIHEELEIQERKNLPPEQTAAIRRIAALAIKAAYDDGQVLAREFLGS